MSRKKKKPQTGAAPATLSDKGYLTSGRARNLPIYKCLVNEGWEEMGMAHVFVLRQHANKNVTAGIYLVDTYCAGVKDSVYYFNITEGEFEERIATVPLTLEEIPYELAHNIIYGAIAFAQDYGIKPDDSFKLTQYILEEDTEDIELIELEFGLNGKPAVYMYPDSGPKDEYILRQLEKNAGPGNYEVIRDAGDMAGHGEDGDFEADDEDDYYNYPEDWDEEEWEEFIEVTEPEQLKNYPAVAFHIFDKTVTPPQAANSDKGAQQSFEFSVSYEPLPKPYSAEETAKATEIASITSKAKPTQTELKKAEDNLQSYINKWPGNPEFHNLLVTVYLKQHNTDKANAAIKEMYQKFPDYLFSKIHYAHLLLEQGRNEEVPAVFNNGFVLKAVYPERDTFEITELIAFSMLMAEYYFKKGDLHTANINLKIIGQLDIPGNISLDMSLMHKIRDAVIKEVEPVLREAKQDEIKKLKLVGQLVK